MYVFYPVADISCQWQEQHTLGALPEEDCRCQYQDLSYLDESIVNTHYQLQCQQEEPTLAGRV